MNRKFKICFFLITLLDLVLSIVLFAVHELHECHGENCFICSLVSLGIALVGILTLILILFPIAYKIKISFVNDLYLKIEKKIERINLRLIDKKVNNFSLVESYVKIQ